MRGWIAPTQLPARAGEAQPQRGPADARTAHDAGDYTLDVRGRAEWEAGHLAHAVLIPLPALADRLNEIPRDRPVQVHCQSGVRSAMATSWLRAHGVDAIDVRGGWNALRA